MTRARTPFLESLSAFRSRSRSRLPLFLPETKNTVHAQQSWNSLISRGSQREQCLERGSTDSLEGMSYTGPQALFVCDYDDTDDDEMLMKGLVVGRLGRSSSNDAIGEISFMSVIKSMRSQVNKIRQLVLIYRMYLFKLFWMIVSWTLFIVIFNRFVSVAFV